MWSPSVIVAVSLAAGLALGDALPAFADAAPLAGALAAALAPLALLLRRLRPLALLAVPALFCCAGAALAIPEGTSAAAPVSLFGGPDPLRFEARVVEPPVRAYGFTQLVVALSRVRVDGAWRPVAARARLFVGGLVFHAGLGDALVGRARFAPPRILDNPGSFDSARALRYAGVSVAASASSPSALVRRADLAPGGLWPALDRERAAMAARLGTGVLGEGALVAALFLGDRGHLTRADRDAFTTTGLSHALAVSGQHLVIVVFLLYRLLVLLLARWPWLARRVSPRRLGAVLALALAITYTLFTGAPYSAVRALVMAGVYLGGAILGRSSRATDALALASAGIMAASPGALFDAGFQLSVVAVIGLFHLAPVVRAWLVRAPTPGAASVPASASASVPPPTSGRALLAALLARAWPPIGRLLAATLAATAITAPLVAYHFQMFTPLGLLGSLFVVPFLELWVLPVACLAAALPWLGDALWPSAGAGAFVMRRALDLLLTLDGAALSVPPPSLPELALLLALALLVPSLRRRAARRLAAVAALVLAVSFTAGLLRHHLDERLRITFLSVGHGDAAVVRLPGGRALLVDGGGAVQGDFDIGRFVVAPALRALGVSRLDAVILSHMHPDHAGGLGHVLRHFDVGELWHNGRPFGHGARAVAEALRARPVRERTFRAGEATTLAFGPAAVDVLHPLLPPDEPEPYFRELGENDNSLTVRIRLGAFSALFPGDLESEGEDLLVKAHPALHATVLKAPHHGSRTSSTPAFLAATQPALVLFSVGEHNAFGFPHPEVAERARLAGASLLRTDLDGAVEVATDGQEVTVRTRRSRQTLRWNLPSLRAIPPSLPSRAQPPRAPAETPPNPPLEAPR